MDELSVSTPAFGDGEVIPAKYTCEGDDVSPPLKWSGVPKGTKSFALTCLDPDAPPGTWVHWVMYDIPADSPGLEENISKSKSLDDGTKQGACWGVDSFDRVGYYGPCPPRGHGYHRYYFTLYALSVETVGLKPNATYRDLEKSMEGNVLGKAAVMGRYKRD